MDKEQREALELSKDDLLAKKAAGRPADVARTAPERIRTPKKNLNQVAIVFGSHSRIVITNVKFGRVEAPKPLDITRADVNA